jgi:uncharacterized protein (DUF362 family)
VGSVVSLVRTQGSLESIKGSISEALSLINFNLDGSIESVVIKPNLCYYWDAATGQTTDPQVVSGIIDFVREKCGEDVDVKVVEADASAMRTKYAFTVLGYERLSQEKNVELFNLSNDSLVEKTVMVGERELSFQVPQLLLNCNLFINVPKLKVMRETKITCAMKNLFGCIGSPRKVVYHPFLDEAIVGINRVLRPHLTIVEGLVALGRFPVKLGLIMAGVDTFSIDWVASQILGYKPSKVRFLKIAMKDGIRNPEGIATRGVNVAEFKKILQKPKFTSSNYWWNAQSRLLKMYCKVVGDVVPPLLDEA